MSCILSTVKHLAMNVINCSEIFVFCSLFYSALFFFVFRTYHIVFTLLDLVLKRFCIAVERHTTHPPLHLHKTMQAAAVVGARGFRYW